MIQVKRVSEAPSPEDGYRILVERFWPRDFNAKHANLDLWLNEVAPSRELHQTFGHNPDTARWEEFQRLYWNELKDKHRSIKMLRKKGHEGTLTLVHAAPHNDRNAALLLKAFLEQGGGAPVEA